jgi:hypothetical protein
MPTGSRIGTAKRACGHLEGLASGFRLNENRACRRFSSEAYAEEGTSSLWNDMLKDCVFGTYRAAAPKFSFRSAGSRYLEFVVTSIDTI